MCHTGLEISGALEGGAHAADPDLCTSLWWRKCHFGRPTRLWGVGCVCGEGGSLSFVLYPLGMGGILEGRTTEFLSSPCLSSLL